MPVKCDPAVPQLELAVQHQNGITHSVVPNNGVQLHYENRLGKLYCGDSLDWLKSLKSETVDLFFADPPYNINKADWDNFESHEHYVAWSREWLEQASRVLKKNGTLY